MALKQSLNARIYEALYRARRVDEEIARAVKEGKIPNPIHLSIGQEAISVGACQALGRGDVVFGTYRSHALYIAKGGSIKKMIAELSGKATGSAYGKGGSMHLGDPKIAMLATSAIVGTGIANAVGYALGLQYRKAPNIVANFFGDGATEEGVFHESLNFAALKKLPIIFICENNRYAIRTHQTVRQARMNIAVRARAYGIPAKQVDGNDASAVYREVEKARKEILKNNSGPRFFECMTYRWKEHLGPGDDFGTGRRSLREARPWMARDPLLRAGNTLGQAARHRIETAVEREIKAAFLFAEKSPFPKPGELFTDVFK